MVSLALSLMVGSALAQTPPTINKAFDTLGEPIAGGMTLGNNGDIYLATCGNSPRVVRLSSSHVTLWTYPLSSGFKIWCPPSVSPDGTRVYFGTDNGFLMCLDTVTGGPKSGFAVTPLNGASVKIRCTPALNFNSSQVGAGGAVYFHSHDGKLHAFNATTGGELPGWPKDTGNLGGPPAFGGHTETWSSSPVIDKNGRIYVGSANGHIYGFTPAGAMILDVNVEAPIEASLAVSAEGWLYGCTRENGAYGSGAMFAINPAAYIPGNPDQAKLWQKEPLTSWTLAGSLAFLASPVIDQSGFVYFTHFGHEIYKLHPFTGEQLLIYHGPGKLCQTPAINQYGQLFLGASAGSEPNGNRFLAFDLATPGADNGAGFQVVTPYWQAATFPGDTDGPDPGPELDGFADFLGCVLIRTTSSGRVYFADMSGKVFHFNSNSPLMAGDWPCFQSNSRHTGVAGSYPYLIAEIPPHYNGDAFYTLPNKLNAWGEVVGQAYGQPNSTVSGFSAAYWINNTTVAYNGSAFVAGSAARSVDNLGLAVGTGGGVPRLWPSLNAPFVNMSVLPEFNLATAVPTDIGYDAESGYPLIIGYGTETATGTVHFLTWIYNGFNSPEASDVGTTAGGQIYPAAISEARKVVGRVRYGAGESLRAFKSQFGVLPTGQLGTLGGLESDAKAIHDTGGIVGWAHNLTAKRRAFRMSTSGAAITHTDELPAIPGTTFAYNSEARSVNRFGQVVGKAQKDSATYRAFLNNPGGYVSGTPGPLDLNIITLDNGLTPASQSWFLSEAIAINDAGVIVGLGTRSGSSRAWILYPKLTE